MNRLVLVLIGILIFVCIGCSDNRPVSTLPSTHSASWIDPESVDFHGDIVIDRGVGSCAKCHGDDMDGGVSEVSCVDCHLSSGACASCHGGVVDNSGAPPTALNGDTVHTSLGVGAHTLHLYTENGLAVECDMCHIVPGFMLDTKHLDLGDDPLDSIAEVTFSGFNDFVLAKWDRDSATCKNVYCHGNFDGGNIDNTPVWTSDFYGACGTCHPVAHNASALHRKHISYIGLDALICGNCHASVMDTLNQFSNKDLHVNGIVDTLTRDPSLCSDCHSTGPDQCYRCHGGLDNQTGAPPTGLNGETDKSDLAVGAHSTHVQNNQYTDPFDCDICHIKPDRIIDTVHLDGDNIAEVTFNALAGETAQWDRIGETCSDVYCHGNFSGGLNAIPTWTGVDQALCGSCHDVGKDPSAIDAVHAFHIGSAGMRCSLCHSSVVDNQMSVVGLELHVNGVADTAISNETLCNSCHLGGQPDCTGCHGGHDNQSGAPPYGLEGEVESNSIAVGAHTAHIDGNGLSDGVLCSECHIVPAAILSFGHLEEDKIAEITFDTLAGGAAVWDRDNTECSSVYCHGNFNGGFTSNKPNWILSGQAECGSCHDVNGTLSTLSGEHDLHVVNESIDCYQCHASTVDESLNITGLSEHVNGINEVVFSSGEGLYNGTSCSGVSCHDIKDWKPF